MNASWPPQSQRFRIKSPRKRTWFCSTSIVAPKRDVREAGLFELIARYVDMLAPHRENAHKMRERIDVFPLPDAPMSRT